MADVALQVRGRPPDGPAAIEDHPAAQRGLESALVVALDVFAQLGDLDEGGRTRRIPGGGYGAPRRESLVDAADPPQESSPLDEEPGLGPARPERAAGRP